MLGKSVTGICVVLASVLFGGDAVAMNKAELIEAIASKSGLSKADSKRALDGFINATSGALKKRRQDFADRLWQFFSIQASAASRDGPASR